MMLIQILIVLFIFFALSRVFLRYREKKISLGLFLFWFLFWLTAVFFVLQPETASRLARFVGVTRGVDLLVYFALLVIFYLVFRILVKIETLEQEITKVVRELARRGRDGNYEL